MSVCKILPIYYNYLQKYEPQHDKCITRKYDIYRTAIITRIVSFLDILIYFYLKNPF